MLARLFFFFFNVHFVCFCPPILPRAKGATSQHTLDTPHSRALQPTAFGGTCWGGLSVSLNNASVRKQISVSFSHSRKRVKNCIGDFSFSLKLSQFNSWCNHCSTEGKWRQEALFKPAFFLIGVRQHWSQENESILFYELRSHEDTQMFVLSLRTMGEYFEKLNLHNRIKTLPFSVWCGDWMGAMVLRQEWKWCSLCGCPARNEEHPCGSPAWVIYNIPPQTPDGLNFTFVDPVFSFFFPFSF